MQSPPFPRYLIPPRSKYSPQHHVLTHPQLPFLPQCQRPSFTPIQNNRQNYNSGRGFLTSFFCPLRALSTPINGIRQKSTQNTFLDIYIYIYIYIYILQYRTERACLFRLARDHLQGLKPTQYYIKLKSHFYILLYTYILVLCFTALVWFSDDSPLRIEICRKV